MRTIPSTSSATKSSDSLSRVRHRTLHITVPHRFISYKTVDSVRTRKGALTEYLAVHTSNLALCPQNVTLTQAAGITLAGLTAYQALFDLGGLQAGQRVFVNGGSTSVGAFAIQMAKAQGCTVGASASAKNELYVRSLGADEVRSIFRSSLLVEPYHSLLLLIIASVRGLPEMPPA